MHAGWRPARMMSAQRTTQRARGAPPWQERRQCHDGRRRGCVCVRGALGCAAGACALRAPPRRTRWRAACGVWLCVSGVTSHHAAPDTGGSQQAERARAERRSEPQSVSRDAILYLGARAVRRARGRVGVSCVYHRRRTRASCLWQKHIRSLGVNTTQKTSYCTVGVP